MAHETTKETADRVARYQTDCKYDTRIPLYHKLMRLPGGCPFFFFFYASVCPSFLFVFTRTITLYVGVSFLQLVLYCMPHLRENMSGDMSSKAKRALPRV